MQPPVPVSVKGMRGALDGRWDLITTFDAIHDMPSPTRAPKPIAAALHAGGGFLIGETGVGVLVDHDNDSCEASRLEERPARAARTDDRNQR